MSGRRRAVRAWIRSVERGELEDRLALLAFLAGRAVAVDESERNAAVRRAELLLAAGGDPRRRLDLYGRAVSAVAADLDDRERRTALTAGLASLQEHVAGLRGAEEALRMLTRDGDLAWQSYAMAVLAEALSDEGDADSLDR